MRFIYPQSIRQKERGKRVVLIRGAFDVLHHGHLRAFCAAKKFGDVLVVALDSDQVVSSRKPGRPIFNQAIRKEMLLHLKPVDYVFTTDVDGAFDILEALLPHVLAVKASSDTPRESGGSRNALKKFCRERRIKIVILPHVKGISTTKILSTLSSI